LRRFSCRRGPSKTDARFIVHDGWPISISRTHRDGDQRRIRPTKPASSFGANLASPASVYLTMKTLDEPSDNKRSKDRRIVERLQNAVSETRQSIVQTQAVIHEVRGVWSDWRRKSAVRLFAMT
jgi:hypothetical protein